MRNKREILLLNKYLNNTTTGTQQMSRSNVAILEVLLDIRDYITTNQITDDSTLPCSHQWFEVGPPITKLQEEETIFGVVVVCASCEARKELWNK